MEDLKNDIELLAYRHPRFYDEDFVFDGELWAEVGLKDGIFIGKYQVSNFGRVKSMERTIVRSNGCKHYVKERILKQRERGRGKMYSAVRLYIGKGGVSKNISKIPERLQPKLNSKTSHLRYCNRL